MTKPLVLVVDDELDNRVMMRYFLESWGYDVDLAENGVLALNKIALREPALVLLDIEMPVMDGFEACRRLRDSPDTAQIPVIMFTALDATADKIEGIRKGADDYVLKTTEPEEIRARIEMVLSRRERYDPASQHPARVDREVLSGSLQEKSFPEAFQLALAYGASGTLMVRDGARIGQVYIVDDTAIHAECGAFTGEAAFYKLAVWNSGQFSYRVGDRAPQKTIDVPGQTLHIEATRRMDEWTRVAELVPDLDVVPHRTAGGESRIELSASQWRLLQNVDGCSSLRQISAILDVDDFEIGQWTVQLMDSGVLTFSPVDEDRRPFWDIVPDISTEPLTWDAVTLTAEQWRLLAHIDGSRSMAELMLRSGLSAEAVEQALERVVELGLARVANGEPGATDTTPGDDTDDALVEP